MTTRDEYVAKLKAQLDQWNAQIAVWEAKAQQVQSEAKSEYQTQLARLRSQQEQALGALKRVQGASLEAWQDLARGADSAWRAMQDAFDKARSHFDGR
jgi:hypothetical protein